MASRLKLKYDYLIAEFKETGSQEASAAICKMIINKELKITHRRDDKLLFLLHSKFEGVCCKCKKEYTFGEPVFCINQKAWHISCASEEDKNQTFYKSCLKKGLIDED